MPWRFIIITRDKIFSILLIFVVLVTSAGLILQLLSATKIATY